MPYFLETPTPSIHTLIPDIQHLLKRKDGWLTPELGQEFGHEVSQRLQRQFEERTEAPTLRLSKLGSTCPCALWHSIHTPEEAEPLPPWAENKFSFGHIIEAWTITLAKAAGHDVRGEQDRVVVDGIAGHRDCVIDGCIVDVKSASSRSFQKFKTGSIGLDDSFGYLDQLDGYMAGSLEDPIVTVKDRAYLLAIDKQLGHMVLYEHEFREHHIHNRIETFKRIVGRDTAPDCTCEVIPDGKSGNLKLGTVASYNAYKYCCKPHLRTFIYSDGPRYLTRVVRKPDVPEVNRHGQIVYH